MNPDVTILHISTGHAGGAGKAARQLNQKLNQQGVHSEFVAIANKGYSPGANEIAVTRNLIEILLGKFWVFISRIVSGKVLVTICGTENRKLVALIETKDPRSTILHFHNTFNLIRLRTIKNLSNRGYKTIVTLHDQRFFTGGCHYSIGCEKFKSNCEQCPVTKKVFTKLPSITKKIESSIYNQFKNKLTIIAPSKWIYEEALKSEVSSLANVFQIKNFLEIEPSSYFQYFTNAHDLIYGLAGMDPFLYIKGGHRVLRIFSNKVLSSNHSRVRLLRDFESHEDFWHSIDVLLLPSVQDNSPNVIIEAKYFGVPIIAHNSGGISENLDFEYDVLLNFDSITISDLEIAAKKIRKTADERARYARSFAERQSYLNSKSINSIISIYNTESS